MICFYRYLSYVKTNRVFYCSEHLLCLKDGAVTPAHNSSASVSQPVVALVNSSLLKLTELMD